MEIRSDNGNKIVMIDFFEWRIDELVFDKLDICCLELVKRIFFVKLF